MKFKAVCQQGCVCERERGPSQEKKNLFPVRDNGKSPYNMIGSRLFTTKSSMFNLKVNACE